MDAFQKFMNSRAREILIYIKKKGREKERKEKKLDLKFDHSNLFTTFPVDSQFLFIWLKKKLK